MNDVDTYETIDQTCERYNFSRRSFYRLLDNPEVKKLIIRATPSSGGIRVPVRAFNDWLKSRQS